jgi:phage terminase large subunit-like protein
LDWQREKLIEPVFGWVHKSTGLRRFRHAYWSMAKKNGKTALCSWVSAYGLIGDHEPAARVYSAACKRDQAAFIYEKMEAGIGYSPALRKHLELVPSRKLIRHRWLDARYEAISADAGSNEGLNASMIIVDELHAWGVSGRKLWNALRYAGAARSQPLIIVISTAGSDLDGIGYEQYELAKAVQAGTIPNTQMHVYIAEADPEDDAGSEATWKKANPSLGITINTAELRNEYEEAKAFPSKMSVFRRYRLNQWVSGETRQPLIYPEEWKKCQALDVPDPELIGKPYCMAVDLSMVDDSTAVASAFDIGGGKIALRTQFFLPQDSIVRHAETDQVPYPEWVRDGWYIVIPGPTVDWRLIQKWIEDYIAVVGKPKEIAYDPWRAEMLADALSTLGYSTVEFRQGYVSMSPACQSFQRLVKSVLLYAGANPVMRWMASNAVTQTDPAGNIKLDKASSRRKIDGVVSSVMAVARMLANQKTAKTSIYERRGLEILSR